MRYNRVPLSASIASKKLLNHGAGSSSETTEFENHGLLLWNQVRQKWTGRKKAGRRYRMLRVRKLRILWLRMATKLWLCCWDTTNNRLLKSSKPFPKPVPLGEMVDFLVDIWEEEGMYD